MAMGNFLGRFAEGMANGYATGMKERRAQELHDLQVSEMRAAAEMRNEIKQVGADVKPSEGFVVVAADGTRTVYTDEKMAKEAQAAQGEGAQLGKTFIAAGQQFDSPEAADEAAAAANAPAAKMRRFASVALKYNRPDVADAYMKNYQNIVETNRRDMQEQFLQAQATGDYGSVLDTVNARLRKTGAQASLVPGENGAMTYQVVKNGQVVAARPFASAQEFWDAMGQQVAQTPDNMLETWRVRETLKQGAQGLRIQEKKADSDIANDAARVKQGERGLDIQERTADANIKHQAGMLGVAQSNAANGAAQVGLGYAQLTQPKVHSGVDEAGNVTFGATQTTYDPKQKTFGLNVIGPQVAPGMRPTPRGNSNGLDALLGGMGQPAPLAIDWSKVPPKNIGGATAPAATGKN